MKEDFGELIQYLDEKFTRIENQLENKADKDDVRALTNAVDAYAKKADAYFQEMVMLAHKVDKLDKWIHQIAEKVGIKLEN